MKGLKFSFAAIIAVIAIGATIAAQAGAFDSKETKKLPIGCYQPTINAGDKTTCARFTVTSASDCDVIEAGDHLFAVGAILADPNSVCQGGSFICCVTVQVDATPCPASGSNPAQTKLNLENQLNFYKVLDVKCRPTQP